MSEVSTFRLYLLRATYLFIAVGLGITIWPGLINHPLKWGLMQSVVSSVLAAVSILAVVGIRYPLAMVPLLLFELLWKSFWLLTVALPLWRADAIDANTGQTVFDCMVGIVILPIAIPWRYVYAHYVKKRGERWR